MNATFAVARVLGVLVIFAMAGTSSARAASPEPALGASVQSIVYANEDRSLTVVNRSTVEALVSFDGTTGWSTDQASIVLAPDAQGVVKVTGDGEEGGELAVSIGPNATPEPGTTQGKLLLVAHVWHARPFDPSQLVGLVLLVAFVGGALVLPIVIRRKST